MAIDNSNGWIKLHRRVMDLEFYYSEPFTKSQAWIDLLMMANHKESFIHVRGTRILVGVGSICMRRENLAKRWQWSPGKVDRFLNMLQDMEMIVVLKKRLINEISIVNYKKYQQVDSADESPDGSPDSILDESADESLDSSLVGSPDGRQTRRLRKEEKKENSLPAAANACEYIKKSFEENRELVWMSESWNEKTKGLFREVSELTDANVERWAFAKCYVDAFGKEKVVEAIARLPNARFLHGKPFVDFDWLFGRDRSRFLKLMEGGYDTIFTNTPTKNNQENDRNQSEREGLRVAKAEDFYKPVHK